MVESTRLELVSTRCKRIILPIEIRPHKGYAALGGIASYIMISPEPLSKLTSDWEPTGFDVEFADYGAQL